MHLDLLRDQSKHLPSVADRAAITSLRIWHCAYSTLEPLSDFANLDTLIIGTFPDASFACLPRLEHLSLLGVLPKNRSLAALERCTGLRTVKVHGFPKDEIARFFSVTGVLDTHCPELVDD